MPDPLSHHTDMITHKPNEMPTFWWLNPWAYARNLKQALHAVHLLSETTEDAYQAAKNVIKQKEELVGRQNKAIVDTANEAGFQKSKTGYVINGEPRSPLPLTWLGEAVAYWKGEAYAARKQRDEAKELADYHRNNLNTFQRKVELALKPACPHLYEDTIGYVQWAADEIKALRASLSVITEDRDAYIEKLQAERDVYCDTVHKLEKAEARVKQLTVFCENAGAERDYEKKRVEEITLLVNERDRWIDTRDKEIIRLTNLTRNLRRKLSKAEKAKPLLWEDKTKTLTHGAGFTFGNHEDRPIRAALGSIRDLKTFVHGIQPKAKKAKAKKKGGAK